MAKLFSNKSMVNIEKNLSEKVAKMNYQETFNDEIIKKNLQQLLGRSTATTIELKNFVENKFMENTAALYSEIENKMVDCIPEDMVERVKETMKLQDEKIKLEQELKNLKLKRGSVLNRNSIEGQMEYMQISIDIDEKEDELNEKQKAFIKAYKRDLQSTQIPVELSILFSQVRNIENEMKEKLSDEIELCLAKVEAMNRAYIYITLVSDMKDKIDERLGTQSQSDKVIRSSEMQIPFIQTLVK